MLTELRQAVSKHETEYKQLQAECDARSETINDLESRLSETLLQLSSSEANSKKREAEFADKLQRQEARINELQQSKNTTSQTVTSEALAKAQEDLQQAHSKCDRLETQLRHSKEQCSAQEHESKKQLAMAEQKSSFLEV